MAGQRQEETALEVEQEMRTIKRYLRKHPKLRKKLVRMVRRKTGRQKVR